MLTEPQMENDFGSKIMESLLFPILFGTNWTNSVEFANN